MISALRNDGQIGLSQLTTDGVDSSFAVNGAGNTPPPDEASVLPEPMNASLGGSDMLFELVALMTRASQSDRNQARQSERMEDMVRTQEEAKKVQEMHDQADSIRDSAWASGLASIGSGACQIGIGTIDAHACKLDWNDGFKALDKGFEGAGKLVSGQFDAQQRLEQANAEADGANADRAGRGSQEAADDVQAARDLLKKIESFYEQMLQAQSGALNAAASMRA